MNDQFLSNIFNNSELLGGPNESELVKTLTAGSQLGSQTIGTTMAGIANLKTESLEPTVRVLESTMQHIRLFNMLPKKNITNTSHQYNMLVKYGEQVPLFMDEGESPEYTDTQYRRESVQVKYMGKAGSLTHQAMLVNRSDGQNAMAAEVSSKTELLIKEISKNLTEANSSIVPAQFDGLWRQHFKGIGAIYAGGATLANYFDDPCVIDARGKVLSDIMVQDAAHAVVNDRFGSVSQIIAPPVVFKDYVNQYQDQKRFIVGQTGSIVGATTGQSVNSIQTQVGNVTMQPDIFMDRKISKAQNAAASPHTKAPNVPIKDGTTPVAVKTNTTTKFGDSDGNYIYGVTSKNRYGESAMVMLNTTAQAVSKTQAVTLKFAYTDGSNPATGFVIYRSKKNDVGAGAMMHPIFEVTKAEHANGYDGGAATEIVDKNYFLAGTHSAMVLEPSTDIWEYIQLAGTMKIDFAIVSMAQKFAVVNYGTPALYQPGKIARIINIGSEASN